MKGKYLAKVLKKSVSFLLTASLCVSLIGLTGKEASAAQFNDTGGHWAESYINKAANLGIINGYTDGTFRPNDSVTRAEFAGMVNRTLGNTGTKSMSFPDVSYYEWYYNDIAKAVSATYVSGYADGYFRPKSPISRQEAAVMLGRIVPTYGYEQSLGAYPDSASVASWAYEAMTKIVGRGYLGAYKNDNWLHPSDPLTRAQTAKILCEIKERETISTSDPIIKTNNTKFSNTIFANNVTFHKDLGNNSASLENCVVLGTINVDGGGRNTITISNTRAANASLNKTSGEKPRLLAKGATTLANLSGSGDGILETSNTSGGEFGKGFQKVSLGTNSDFEFRGSFPSVSVDGTNAIARLESGTISDLKVTSSGRGAKVYVTRGANIKSSEVNASSSFYGAGTIDYMRVNSSGVTYETKPKSLSVSSGANNPSEDDDYTDGAKFYPSRGADDVGINTSITITFETRMTKYNGSTINNSDIPDFVTLRPNSSNGSSISISGTINSTKREITITPSRSLERDTKYYITVDRNALKDSDGYGNAALSSYFYTGTGSSSSSSPFYPENGDSSVSLDSDIVLNFKSEVIRYSNGATISTNDSYLQDCIQFNLDGSGGESVPFSARINSNKNSITIRPDKYLLPGRTYYVSILSNKLKYATDGTPIPGGSAAWTTAGTPVLSNFKVTESYQTYLKLTGSSSVNGTLYTVATSSGEPAPTASQVVSGRNTYGVVAPSGSASVRSGYSATLQISGLAAETSYTVYGVIRDSAGNLSPVMSASAETSANYLNNIRVISGNDGSFLENFKFNPSTYVYGNGQEKLYVPSGTTYVNLEFDTGNNPNAVITVNGKTTNKVDIIDKTADGLGVLTLKVQYQSAPGKPTVEYFITLYEKGSTNIDRIAVNAGNGKVESLFNSSSSSDITDITSIIEPDKMIFNVQGAEIGATVTIVDGSGQELASEKVTAKDTRFTKLNFIPNQDGNAVIRVHITSKDGISERVLTININFQTP